MLVIVPKPFRKRPPKSKGRAKVAPPLALVAVDYDEGAAVTLTFNQAVDVSLFKIDLLSVNDGLSEILYRGSGEAIAVSPTVCEVPLIMAGSGDFGTTWLSVEPGNDVVAVQTGTEWAGVELLPIPFG